MKKFKVTKISEAEARNNNLNNYNFNVWNTKISRMTEYEDVEFYFNEEDNEMYVEYTIPEGIRLWIELTYHSMLTNGGFYRLDRYPITEDGKDTMDAIELMRNGKEQEALAIMDAMEGTTHFEVSYGTFFTPDGEEALYGTSKEARQDMARKSREHNVVFTKG